MKGYSLIYVKIKIRKFVYPMRNASLKRSRRMLREERGYSLRRETFAYISVSQTVVRRSLVVHEMIHNII
jgi:hypothetical protein